MEGRQTVTWVKVEGHSHNIAGLGQSQQLDHSELFADTDLSVVKNRNMSEENEEPWKDEQIGSTIDV